jgi:hypothetical protein
MLNIALLHCRRFVDASPSSARFRGQVGAPFLVKLMPEDFNLLRGK